MYAVLNNGNRQYRVSSNQILYVEKVPILGNKNIIEFNQVIMIVNCDVVIIGNPFINKAKVIAELLSYQKNKKISIIKFIRRKHFRKKIGHRQCLMKIKIISIDF